MFAICFSYLARHADILVLSTLLGASHRVSSHNSFRRAPFIHIAFSRIGCDACRARKVRCARDNPDDSQSSCKHCVTLGIPCTYDYQPKKRGPPNLYGIAASLTRSSLIPDLRSPPPQVLAPTTGSCRCRCGPTPARVPKWRGYFPSFCSTEYGQSKTIGHRVHTQHWPDYLHIPRAVIEQRWTDPVLRHLAIFALPDHRRCVSGTIPTAVFVFFQWFFCC